MQGVGRGGRTPLLGEPRVLPPKAAVRLAPSSVPGVSRRSQGASGHRLSCVGDPGVCPGLLASSPCPGPARAAVSPGVVRSSGESSWHFLRVPVSPAVRCREDKWALNREVVVEQVLTLGVPWG